MKKICYITTVSSTIKAFFLETLDCLSKSGYEVSVICNTDEELPGLLSQGVRYIPVDMVRGISIVNGIRVVRQLRGIFKNEKFDLIQYSTPNAALYSSIAGNLAGIKIKVYHNMGFVFLSFHGVKRGIFRLLEKITCGLSDKVQFVSKSNLSYAIESGIVDEKKAYIIWNGSSGGIDLKRFHAADRLGYKKEIRQKFGIKNEEFLFGFVGRINKDKGIQELFTAYRQIRNDSKYQDCVKLLVVGPEEDLGFMEKSLLESIRRDENVIFCGSQPEIEKFYAVMDVLVFPSYREGFGNAVIEAEAMGIPVIASDIPGPSDTVLPGETGLLCKPRDPENLERCMRFLLDNRHLIAEYGAKGVQYSTENYDSKILVQRILEDKNNLLHN